MIQFFLERTPQGNDMNAKERQAIILKMINESGSVNIKDIAKLVKVSDMTIRRDLDKLETNNLIKRKYGKAISIRGTSFEPSYEARVLENSVIKEALGEFAASLVHDGDCLGFDSGTTVYQLAKNLIKVQNLTVVSHSLNIINLFKSSTVISEIISLGGIIRREENSFIGDLTIQSLKNFYVDKLFLGVGGITEDGSITDFNYNDANVKKYFMPQAKEVVLLADSSKFNRQTFVKFGHLSDITTLVTNKTPPPNILNCLEQADVELLVLDRNNS